MEPVDQETARAGGVTMTWVLTFKPGVADRFWADILTSLEGTRSFPGCLRADMYRHRDAPDRIMLSSDWKSHHDYQAYAAWRARSDRLLAGVPASQLSSLLAQPSVRQFWDVRA